VTNTPAYFVPLSDNAKRYVTSKLDGDSRQKLNLPRTTVTKYFTIIIKGALAFLTSLRFRPEC